MEAVADFFFLFLKDVSLSNRQFLPVPQTHTHTHTQCRKEEQVLLAMTEFWLMCLCLVFAGTDVDIQTEWMEARQPVLVVFPVVKLGRFCKSSVKRH